MKNLFNLFKQNSTIIHITAAALIVCMGLVDASMYINYATDQADDLRVITEEHEMETAMADGVYDGNGSDSENGGSGKLTIAEGKHLFSILEILPTEKKGVVGYTIGGCEPFDVDEIKSGNKVLASKEQMKQAYMDALVNPNPGSDNGNDQNIVNNYSPAKYLKELRAKLQESSESYPFEFEHSQLISGHYRYVGKNKGVYSITKDSNGNPTSFNSKFYNSGSDFDYIFIEGEASSNSADVNVTNQKRIRYVNNEKFIKDWLGKTDAETLKMKQNTVFEVNTRTPVSVTLDDIERADLILINDAYKGDSYSFALKIQNIIRGETNEDLDSGLHFYSPENDGKVARANRIDFDDFEKVIRIYERVVVRQDAGFVAEKTCCTSYYGGELTSINTNIRKLMFMLFYVKQGSKTQAGRDLFSDFFKRYTSDPGEEYLEKRKLHLADPDHYPVDYRAASLKRNTSDPTEPGYYYMHMHASYHVGHPLVVDKNECITGVETQKVGVEVPTEDGGTKTVNVTLPVLSGGSITPLHDSSIIESRRLTIETADEDMFKDEGFTRQDNPRTVDQKKYYGSNDLFFYDYCYESMSNTTDYIYIDNAGRLIVDTKYSSDQNNNITNYWKYWYKIDADFHAVGGSTFRRRKWGQKVWDVDDPWPWDSSQDGGLLTEWLMHRKTEGNIYDCNMHMWYDYWQQAESAGMEKYTTVKSPPFGQTFENQSLMEENGFFKGTWISGALGGRKIFREETDINHVEKTEKNYYISMNILNGDGVNENAATKNKTLYFNKYEKDDIEKYEKNLDTRYPNPARNAKIPIKIRIKTSCKLGSVKVYKGKDTSGPLLASYSINSNASNSVITCTGNNGKVLELTPKNTIDGTGFPELRTEAPDLSPIYTYEGSIYDLMSSNYMSKRNSTFTVEFTAILPDNKTERSITDQITIVKRDFFMLD